MKRGVVRSVTDEDFARQCNELLEDVEAHGDEILITRGGAAVARLIPSTEAVRPFVGRSRRTIQASADDLIAPVGKDWEADSDL
jgi:antitoxin (DNA-binding transcriptional repressor) of toxin-antitoxin stability system